MVEVLGLKELERKLKALGQEVGGKNLVGKALRKGANVIRDEARGRAPYDPSNDGVHIRDQIKVRRDSNPSRKGMSEIMYVKPFYTKKFPVSYWRFQEFGTVALPALRYMTKGFESGKKQALFEFKVELGKLISIEARKLAK